MTKALVHPALSPSLSDDSLKESNLTRFLNDLEATISVRGGEALLLRPIRSDDDERLVSLHRQLSDDSIYRRYFSFHPQLSHAEVHHLTHVDYDSRLALVIENHGELVGVARYERYSLSKVAEVAFIVRDDYQHLGLGTQLLAHLACAARSRDITTFTAVTLYRNHDMMSVFRHSGLPMTSTVTAGEINVRLSLGAADAASAKILAT